ncbi:MAG: mRNA cleavage and polyadenylation factor subunit [Icmadophila ericetorum]|nr:mRNA cleavage and polyadenylation factor subunit [Icmadophila ericetorum]
MSLEVSENTHARRPLVVVGTTVICGEDLTAQGRIYIFDIIPVVPEPDHPETDRKLKLIAKEEVKGAVTALSGLGSEGFLLAAQGQKCMVRGLKEDGTLLPVAFMDMQCYVSVAKELRGTGLCVMGDAMKGVWLTGYTEDPYQLRLFGKSSTHLEVVTAEFFPDGENLYIIVIDTDSNLHIFQFNPDHPKSLAGTRLLPLTAFHTGSFHHRSYLLPPRPNKTPTEDTTSLPHHILLTSPLGTLSLLSPLPPTGSHSYSQMQSLANHLQNTLLQPAGLNPKMFRASTVDVGLGGRGVVDGNLLRRVGEEGGSGSVGKIGNGRASGGVRGWF